jgi:hypothetical protein
MKFEWIIPVIVVVVWIINAIVKAREEEPVRPKRPAEGPRGGRNATGDIDRFLQEIDRLRKQQPDRAEPVARPTPLPRARPVPATTPSPRARPVPVVRPVEPLPTVIVADLPPATAPAFAPLPTLESAPVIAPQRAVPLSRPTSPRVALALNLLRAPQSAGAAVILQEVLGPPKCKRR